MTPMFVKSALNNPGFYILRRKSYFFPLADQIWGVLFIYCPLQLAQIMGNIFPLRSLGSKDYAYSLSSPFFNYIWIIRFYVSSHI